MEKLLPCPFCGAEATSDNDQTAERVGCGSKTCPTAYVRWRRSEWNTRHPQPASEREERYRRALEKIHELSYKIGNLPDRDLVLLAKSIAREALDATAETREDGASLIVRERARQISAEGWTAAHDDAHRHGDLAVAAAILAVSGTDATVTDPLERDGWGLVEKHRADPVRCMVIAGALIAAEIDRMIRRRSLIHHPEAKEQKP